MKRFLVANGSRFARFGVHYHNVMTGRAFRGGIRL